MNARILAPLVASCSLVALAARAADPVPHRFTAGTPAKAAEVNADFDAIVAQLQALVPVGTVLAFAGTTAPPGFLLCDGAEVSRTTYAALFAVIGISHGGGNAVDTFNVPDYRGRFLRGADLGAGRDPGAASRTAMASLGVTGDAVGSVEGGATARPVGAAFTTSTDGAHTHQSPTTSGVGGTYEVGTGQWGYDYGLQSAPTSSAGAHGHAIAAGGDAETRPVNAAVNYIVKY